MQSLWCWHDTICARPMHLSSWFGYETNKYHRRKLGLQSFLRAMRSRNLSWSRLLGMQNMPWPSNGIQALRHQVRVHVQGWLLDSWRLLRQQRWLHSSSRWDQRSAFSHESGIFQKPSLWFKPSSNYLANYFKILLTFSHRMLEVRRQQKLPVISEFMRAQLVRYEQRSMLVLHQPSLTGIRRCQLSLRWSKL